MTKPQFLRLALPTPLRKLFDYLPPKDIDINTLTPGVRVRVPFHRRQVIGVLVEVAHETTVPYGKLRQAEAIIDTQSLFPPDIYDLCVWAADYYHYSLGEVLMAALPALLRKGRQIDEVVLEDVHEFAKQPILPDLNPAQQTAVDTITHANAEFRAFLIDGVTGSGKTEVYLRVIDAMLAKDQQVLVLVPEISLTPQTIARFRERFSFPIAALHSAMSDKERLNAWMAARAGNVKIVIGTRSAIFTPFKQLGMIIVDEEHDASFKQQERFRYHARDMAIIRANANNIPVILGSATPSLESLLNVKRDRYQLLSLPERAGNAVTPTCDIVDLRTTSQEEGLSSPLIEAMKRHLDNGNQVMLYLNRRGFAPVWYCTQCAWIAECKRCDSRMVYHSKPPRLQCHHCDSRASVQTKCGQCQHHELKPVGIGTQRLEEVLSNHFPEVPIIRVDRDNTRKKGAMQTLFDQIHKNEKAILLGTQMLAKGHHFPGVTLVGIIDADSGLFSADFRASEQMGQLLVQVSGRAGREDKPGQVIIQTSHPEHPLLQTLVQQDYAAFAKQLLTDREEGVLPPYAYFAVFRAEAHSEQTANDFLSMIRRMSETLPDAVSIMGPVPALLGKRKGFYRKHLLVRSNKRSTLQHFLKNILQQIEKQPKSYPVKWVLDVDPIEVV